MKKLYKIKITEKNNEVFDYIKEKITSFSYNLQNEVDNNKIQNKKC